MSKGRWSLLFVGATCRGCRDLVRAAGRVSKDHRWGVHLVVVAHGSHEQNEEFHKLVPDLMVLSNPEGSAQQAYAVEHTPFALLVEDGRVRAKGIVNHRDHLEALLDRQVTERPDVSWTPVGENAPFGRMPASPATRDG